MARRPHPIAWGRAHPFAADALLAAALTLLNVATLGQPDDVDYRAGNLFSLVLVGFMTVPIAWRRVNPVLVYSLVAASTVAYEVMGFPSAQSVGVGVALYTVAVRCDRRTALRVLVVTAALVVLVFATARWAVTVDTIISNLVLFGGAWLVGDSLRTRRRYVAGLEERARLAEAEQKAEAERAAARERARIARELHDVVAHSMSVMVVQAGAARRTLRQDPDQATQALESVEATGREAMTEMRRLLGVLRTDEDTALAPQPSLRMVGDLVHECAEAGLPVEVEVSGDERDLPPGVDLSVYRIVQEALTNTLKHAGPAQATVHLRYDPDQLHVRVVDDGRGAAAADDGQGHGLVGMRERVELFGGELRTGPRRGGGYEVRARLPLDPVAT